MGVFQDFQSFSGRVSLQHIIASIFEDESDNMADIHFVVNNQDTLLHGFCA
jgi:hypothetical protein